MELPPRDPGDQLLPPGELTDIRRRLRPLAARHGLSAVIACAFDHRTRMLPFFYADVRMAPAGPRAIGSALNDSGLGHMRIVLQQWKPHFKPSLMRLDGRLPDLLLISSMSLHTAACQAMLRDIGRVEPQRRPLVIAGGSLCIYEPWQVFGIAGADGRQVGADVACTGEEYVLLNLLEVLLSDKSPTEPIRRTFCRAREGGALDAVPGLVYPRTDSAGQAVELVDTGVQRLAGDLDETPWPMAGFAMLEPPGRGTTLAPAPLAPNQVRRYSRIASLVMTFGCRFSCEYCPIPGYNQHHLRAKSAPRLVEEFHRLNSTYGLRRFFGTDDNFLSDRARSLEILEALASAQPEGNPLHRRIRWGTEAAVHDTLTMREHVPLMHRAGMRALWLGVEDMSGTLIRKGQDANRTVETFELLVRNGISPMPMLMHHDRQPLISRRDGRGLLNQVRILRKAGAVSLQVLMLTPSAGSKSYDNTFRSGMVYRTVGGRPVEPYMYDGNYVIASSHRRPWRKQFNILAAYVYFYNGLRLLARLARTRTPLKLKPAGMQIIGLWGLAYTFRHTLGWMLRLMLGRIVRCDDVPRSALPMRSPDGSAASHARAWQKPAASATPPARSASVG
jgi:radical SAM superfamily enzyme YgiQ (UPF0313 family)